MVSESAYYYGGDTQVLVITCRLARKLPICSLVSSRRTACVAVNVGG